MKIVLKYMYIYIYIPTKRILNNYRGACPHFRPRGTWSPGVPIEGCMGSIVYKTYLLVLFWLLLVQNIFGSDSQRRT